MDSRATYLLAARSQRRLWLKTFARYDGAGRFEDCGIWGDSLKSPVGGTSLFSLSPLPVSVLDPLLHLLPLFFFFGFLDSEVGPDVIQAAREGVPLWGWVEVASHNRSGIPTAVHTEAPRERRSGIKHHGREERVLAFFGSNCGLLYTFQAHKRSINKQSTHYTCIYSYVLTALSSYVKIYLLSTNFVFHFPSFRPIFGVFGYPIDQNPIHFGQSVNGSCLTRSLDQEGSRDSFPSKGDPRRESAPPFQI